MLLRTLRISNTKPKPAHATASMVASSGTEKNIMNPVTIDFEDAQAIAQNLSEHLQYDEGDDYDFWEAILVRLNHSIRHSQQN